MWVYVLPLLNWVLGFLIGMFIYRPRIKVLKEHIKYRSELLDESNKNFDNLAEINNKLIDRIHEHMDKVRGLVPKKKPTLLN